MTFLIVVFLAPSKMTTPRSAQPFDSWLVDVDVLPMMPFVPASVLGSKSVPPSMSVFSAVLLT